jgi:hypothetical protein
MASIELWEAALRQDIRLNGNTRRIARVLASRFHDDRCQVSFEHLAGLAGFIELKTVREAVGLLRRTGWGPLRTRTRSNEPRVGISTGDVQFDQHRGTFITATARAAVLA